MCTVVIGQFHKLHSGAGGGGRRGGVGPAVFPRPRGFIGAVFDLDAVGEALSGALDVFLGELRGQGFELAVAGVVEEAEDAAIPLQTAGVGALVNGLLQHPRFPGFDEIPVEPES